MTTTLWLLMAAILVNGLLAGASMDQSIKQLPARHRIGPVAYSEYSKAADLGNGIVWYAILGAGGAILTVVAAAGGLLGTTTPSATAALWATIVLTVAHSYTTTRAAPTNHSQRKAADPEQLTAIFQRFVRWQTARVSLQVLTLLAVAWAFAATLES